MKNKELTKSQIIRSAALSFGSSLQQKRRELSLRLDNLSEDTNIPISSIDKMELGLSHKLNHAIKLALYYNCEIKIELVKFSHNNQQ